MGGVFVLAKQFLYDKNFDEFKEIPLFHWVQCGILFIIYISTSYISMVMVNSDFEIMVVVIIRFLWPLFTVLLAIPMLGQKASKWIILSVLLSLSGVIIASTKKDVVYGEYSINWAAYAVSLIMSLSWALYNNLTKKYMSGKSVDAIGIYMVVSGLILSIISFMVDEPRNFSVSLILEIAYQAIIVGAVATALWNISIKKGNMILIVLISNFLPIISVITTALILKIDFSVNIVIGSMLVVIGTIWGKKCFKI